MAMFPMEAFRELERLMPGAPTDARARSMPMDAYRRGDDLHVDLDLPGVDPGSIELTVERNVLSVTARREHDRGEDDQVLVNERPQGIFRRQVFLDEGLDTDQLQARYADGVLRIEVPVLASARPKRVPIEVGGGTQAAIGTGDAAA